MHSCSNGGYRQEDSLFNCETRLSPLKVTLTQKTSKTAPGDRKQNRRQSEAREQAKGKVTVTVFIFSAYCFYSNPPPQEEAVFVICKSNDEMATHQTERCEHMAPVLMGQA